MTDTTTIAEPVRRPRPLAHAHGLKRDIQRARLSLAAGLRLSEPLSVALVATLVLSAYFALLPGVDMAVSALFHFGTSGFDLSQNIALKALRKSSTFALLLIVLGLLGEIIVGLRQRAGRFRIESRRATVLMLGLAIGPGLIVNGLLKSIWGRPRPIQIEDFGGEATFARAWQISDQCQSNCSFVSGEASSAAWMATAVILMTPPELRRWTVLPILTYAAALSLNRLAFGGHFLSDILLSWAITALVICILHKTLLACPVQARRDRRRRRPGFRPA